MNNQKELIARITWALSSLSPQVDITDYSPGKKPLLVVQIISETFARVPTFTRNMMVDDYLSRRDPELYRQYELAYECHTADEFALGYSRKQELH